MKTTISVPRVPLLLLVTIISLLYGNAWSFTGVRCTRTAKKLHKRPFFHGHHHRNYDLFAHLTKTSLNNRRNDDDIDSSNDSNLLIQFVDISLQALSIPSFANVVSGIPIGLLIFVAVTPFSSNTSLITILVFVTLSWFGRAVAIDDDYDDFDTDGDDDSTQQLQDIRNQVDLASLVTALLASSLLTPPDLSVIGWEGSETALSLVCGSVALLWFGGLVYQVRNGSLPLKSVEKEMLETWDYEFFRRKVSHDTDTKLSQSSSSRPNSQEDDEDEDSFQ